MSHETQENIHAETFGKFLPKAARSQLLYIFMSLQWSVLPLPEDHLAPGQLTLKGQPWVPLSRLTG